MLDLSKMIMFMQDINILQNTGACNAALLLTCLRLQSQDPQN